MIPFKGASDLKRFLLQKPKNWCYELLALVGMSGYVYNNELDGEKSKKQPLVGCYSLLACGKSGFVVLRLKNYLERNTHKLLFDNYFCSPDLAKYLASEEMWATAALTPNCSGHSLLSSKKILKKLGQGGSKENLDKDNLLVVTSWFDNKRVLLISNFVGKETLGEYERFDHTLKGKLIYTTRVSKTL